MAMTMALSPASTRSTRITWKNAESSEAQVTPGPAQDDTHNQLCRTGPAFDSDPPGAFEPEEISTNIADVDAYLWTDGTNDLQFNGMAFTPAMPTFDPAGYGQFTGIVTAYLPSPTQRETLVGMATTQPSVFDL